MNENNENKLYSGLYCSASGGVHIGVFYDQACTSQWTNSPYETLVPYSSNSMVKTTDCISCLDEDENNNNQNGGNNNNNGQNYYNNGQNYNYQNGEFPEISEICQTAWKYSAHCESNMALYKKDETGCSYINSVLPLISGKSSSSGGSAFSNKNNKKNYQQQVSSAKDFHKRVWKTVPKNTDQWLNNPRYIVAAILCGTTVIAMLLSCCLYGQVLRLRMYETNRAKRLDNEHTVLKDPQYEAPVVKSNKYVQDVQEDWWLETATWNHVI